MQFNYFAGEQKSPEWFKIRRGVPSASRLEDWLALSKAKTGTGKKLKKRLDYEQELMFERTFDKSFEFFTTSAMQDGIDYEDFVRKEYEKTTGNTVEEAGCWYNEYFAASPDGLIGDDGLLEVKVLKDNSFTEVLTSGVPDKHWKQVQGQLFASGRKWCDYVAANLGTEKFKIIRVEPDKEFHEWLELTLTEPLSIEPFSTDGVYDMSETIPEGERPQIEAPFADGDF